LGIANANRRSQTHKDGYPGCTAVPPERQKKVELANPGTRSMMKTLISALIALSVMVGLVAPPSAGIDTNPTQIARN
jgi:hypothetical protein